MPIGGVQFSGYDEDDDDYNCRAELYQEEPREQFAKVYRQVTLLNATGPAYAFKDLFAEGEQQKYQHFHAEEGKSFVRIVDWEAVADFVLERAPKKYEKLFPDGVDLKISITPYDLCSHPSLQGYDFTIKQNKETREYEVHFRIKPEPSKSKPRVNLNPFINHGKREMAEEALELIFAKYPVTTWKVSVRSVKGCDSIRNMSQKLGIVLDMSEFDDIYSHSSELTDQQRVDLFNKLKDWWNTPESEAQPKEGKTDD